MSPQAIIVRERRPEAPTRRLVYAPRDAGGYTRTEQWWRASICGWHTAGSELVTDLHIDRPEDQR